MTARLCGARPVEGTARCDLPPLHPSPHSAPLRIGGRVTFREDHRMAFDKHNDEEDR